jgi:hypothetical protein
MHGSSRMACNAWTGGSPCMHPRSMRAPSPPDSHGSPRHALAARAPLPCMPHLRAVVDRCRVVTELQLRRGHVEVHGKCDRLGLVEVRPLQLQHEVLVCVGQGLPREIRD